MTDPCRREFHPDAPRLRDLLGDDARASGDHCDLAHRILPLPAEGEEWADVDHLWAVCLERGLRAPGFRLLRDGVTLPRSEVCRSAAVGNRDVEDLIDPNRVLALHGEGATVVLQALQHVDRTFGRLSNNLALDLDEPVQVNAYLSPARARGLSLHFDYHDVIVVQLEGSKRWRVWAPTEQTGRPLRHGPGVPAPAQEDLGAPFLDAELEPGSTLHVPRGYPHCAETAEHASIHLTLGIMSLTWERLIRTVLVGGVSGTDLADRLRPATNGELPAPIGALEDLAHRLEARDLERLVRREVWKRQPRTRLRPVRPPVIGADTMLRITPGPLMWLTREDGCTLHLGDRSSQLPEGSETLAEAVLASQGVFCVRGLVARAGTAEGPRAPVGGAPPGECGDSDTSIRLVDLLAAEGVVVRA